MMPRKSFSAASSPLSSTSSSCRMCSVSMALRVFSCGATSEVNKSSLSLKKKYSAPVVTPEALQMLRREAPWYPLGQKLGPGALQQLFFGFAFVFHAVSCIKLDNTVMLV